MDKIEKNQIAQVGNFIVTKETGGTHEWISVRAVSGVWNMRYRDDSAMFYMIDELSREKQFEEYLHGLFNMCFICANNLTDLQFMADFAKNYEAFVERKAKDIVPLSDEEDAKILEEERMRYEMEQELGKEEISPNE